MSARRSELGAIVDLIPDAVRVFDADGTIVRSNARAQRDHEGLDIVLLAELLAQVVAES